MKVAIMQEGYFHCETDKLLVFSSLELAIKHVPKDFKKEDISDPNISWYGHAPMKNNTLERWLTIIVHTVIGEELR
jgi:hypothetical protein